MRKPNKKERPRRDTRREGRSERAPRPAPRQDAGPIGAMLRWARLNRRLAGIVTPDAAPAPGVKPAMVRRLRRLEAPGFFGVTRAAIDEAPLELRPELQKPPMTIAELPTHALYELARSFGPRLPAGLIANTMAALIHGCPVLFMGDPATAAPLVSARLAIRGTPASVEERFGDLGRVASALMVESYPLAEKPLLVLLDIEREAARGSTLKNSLVRQVESRARWVARAIDRGHAKRVLRPAAEDEPAPILILDLLPLIITRLDGPNAQLLAQALTTPLGVMLLGLCPAIVIPPARAARGEPEE